MCRDFITNKKYFFNIVLNFLTFKHLVKSQSLYIFLLNTILVLYIWASNNKIENEDDLMDSYRDLAE